jgi:integrase
MAFADEDDPVMAAFLITAACTRARRAELVALPWSDIDWEGSQRRTRPTRSASGKSAAIVRGNGSPTSCRRNGCWRFQTRKTVTAHIECNIRPLRRNSR